MEQTGFWCFDTNSGKFKVTLIFGPHTTEGPTKSWLPVHPSISSAFSSGMAYYFFWFLALWEIIGMFKNCPSLFFPEKFIFAKIWAKKSKMAPWPQKRVFWIFWKLLLLAFLKINLKWKLTLLLIFQIPFLVKLWVSSYGPNRCEPIKLQGSLKCNISRNMWIINFIFCMQINIKAL